MSAAAGGAAAAAAAAEKLRRDRLEEEAMTAYVPKDLDGWQFKIVRGSFRTAEHLQALQVEQAQYGWNLVEVFDQERVRFKRPASEVLKDAERFGNPYNTKSACGGVTQQTVAVLVVLGCLLALLAAVMILVAKSSH